MRGLCWKSNNHNEGNTTLVLISILHLAATFRSLLCFDRLKPFPKNSRITGIWVVHRFTESALVLVSRSARQKLLNLKWLNLLFFHLGGQCLTDSWLTGQSPMGFDNGFIPCFVVFISPKAHPVYREYCLMCDTPNRYHFAKLSRRCWNPLLFCSMTEMMDEHFAFCFLWRVAWRTVTVVHCCPVTVCNFDKQFKGKKMKKSYCRNYEIIGIGNGRIVSVYRSNESKWSPLFFPFSFACEI